VQASVQKKALLGAWQGSNTTGSAASDHGLDVVPRLILLLSHLGAVSAPQPDTHHFVAVIGARPPRHSQGYLFAGGWVEISGFHAFHRGKVRDRRAQYLLPVSCC